MTKDQVAEGTTKTFYRVVRLSPFEQVQKKQGRLPEVADGYSIEACEFIFDKWWRYIEEDGQRLNVDPYECGYGETPKEAADAYARHLVNDAKTHQLIADRVSTQLSVFQRVKDYLVKRSTHE